MRVMEGIYMRKTPKIEAALTELKQLIREEYPTATIKEGMGVDPIAGFYLDVTVDVEDTDEVRKVYIDRLVDIQVDEELPIYVSLRHTPERRKANQREYLAARAAAELVPRG